MRIGIFTECYKPTINGVVMSIMAFRNQLEKNGHQVYICAPRYKKAEFEPNVFRVPSFTLPSPSDYPIGVPYFSNLVSEIAKINLDIIHTQHIFMMGGFGQFIGRIYNIPTVHTYHTIMTEYAHYVPVRFLQGLVKKYIISRSRRFCNRANQVIVPSSPIIGVLKTYGVKTPIKVLPTGIDLKQYRKLNENERAILLKKFKINPDKKILLYVGRIAKEKNLDFLLKCFNDLLKLFSNAHLVFVGSGPYLNNLKSQIQNLKIDKQTTLTGFLEKSETNRFFGAADIFVFPSTTDTQGIVLSEALASGTPAVAVSQLGPKDIIKNNEDGFLVALDQGEFKDKTLKLLKDEKLRNKFSKKAKDNVKRFSIENCTQELIKIYKYTIQQHGRSNK